MRRVAKFIRLAARVTIGSLVACSVGCRPELPLDRGEVLDMLRHSVTLLQLQTYDDDSKSRGPLVLDLEGFARAATAATGQPVSENMIRRAMDGPFEAGRLTDAVQCDLEKRFCQVNGGAAIVLDSVVVLRGPRETLLFFTVAKNPYDFVRDRREYCAQTVRARFVQNGSGWSFEGLTEETQC